MNKTLSIILIALAGLGGGTIMYQWLNAPSQTVQHKTTATKDMRPAFTLRDLENHTHNIKEWDGKVIMVNFWATWCPPCRREIPALVQLYEDYKDKDFTIIGIAIDEKQAVQDFVDPMGIEYPVLLGDQDGVALSRAFGNRLGVLPYTVIIDRTGHVTIKRPAELTYQQAEALIKPLL